MKKNYFYLKIILINLFISILSLSAFSQDAMVELIKAGSQDANVLFENYLSPVGKGFGAAMSGGWYNTAKTHKLGGFDITFSLNMAMVPEADKVFTITNSLFTSLRLGNSLTTATSPTISGDDTDGPLLELVSPATTVNVNGTDVTIDEAVLSSFNMPAGVPALVGVPAPTLKAGVGLPFGFELMGQMIPTVEIPDLGSVSLWGIGLKHNFLQWLPLDKLLPFSASILLAYNQLNYSIPLTLTPADLVESMGSDNVVNLSQNASLYDEQLGAIKVSSFIANVIVSKKLLMLTPYVGFGLNSSKFNLGINGNYPITNLILDPTDADFIGDPADVNFGKPIVRDKDVLTDPIDFDISNKMFNITAGLRIKLAIFTIHGQYTIQPYKMYSGGIGLSFR